MAYATHASLLLKQGLSPEIVAERLGHSTVTLTLDRYSHVLPSIQREAADALDVALRRAIAEKSREQVGD